MTVGLNSINSDYQYAAGASSANIFQGGYNGQQYMPESQPQQDISAWITSGELSEGSSGVDYGKEVTSVNPFSSSQYATGINGQYGTETNIVDRLDKIDASTIKPECRNDYAGIGQKMDLYA